MKFNLILLGIFGLIVNFAIYANGYFISETLQAQIKTRLSNILGPKPNRIVGIISAPDFGIEREETIITDDDNEIMLDEDFTPEINFPIEGHGHLGGNEHRPRPLGIHPIRPVESNEPIDSFGPKPVDSFGPKPRLGNLRGNNRLGERALHMKNYIGDEDIIEYNELDFFGPESNPDIYPNIDSYIDTNTDTNLETNIQSECATANYLRKAGFPESTIGTMVCIAKYESGFNCDATNKNTDGSTDYGEFQINSYWWCSGDPKSKYNGCGVSCSSLFNCQSNANCAYTVWKQQGYNAWYGYLNHKSTCDSYPKPC